CGENGDATRLGSIYVLCLTTAHTSEDTIHTTFVNQDGSHAVGQGKLRQALDIAATIEASKRGASKRGATDCLTTIAAPGNSSYAGTPTDLGKAADPVKPTGMPTPGTLSKPIDLSKSGTAGSEGQIWHGRDV